MESMLCCLCVCIITLRGAVNTTLENIAVIRKKMYILLILRLTFSVQSSDGVPLQARLLLFGVARHFALWHFPRVNAGLQVPQCIENYRNGCGIRTWPEPLWTEICDLS